MTKPAQGGVSAREIKRSTVFKTRAKLDLDALHNNKGMITIDGEDLYFDAPTVGDIIGLSTLAGQFQGLEGVDNPSPEQLESLGIAMEVLEEKIIAMIPGLEGKNISFDRLMALLDFLLEMAMPEDEQEAPPQKGTPQDHLTKKGQPRKKAPSAGSKK